MQFVLQPFIFTHSALHSVTKHPKSEGGVNEWTTLPVLHNDPVQYSEYSSRYQSHTSNIFTLTNHKNVSRKNASQNSGKQNSWVSSYDNVSFSLGQLKSLQSIHLPLVLLISVHYVTLCSPREGLSNTSACPTIGGNHHFQFYFKYILNILTLFLLPDFKPTFLYGNYELIIIIALNCLYNILPMLHCRHSGHEVVSQQMKTGRLCCVERKGGEEGQKRGVTVFDR